MSQASSCGMNQSRICHLPKIFPQRLGPAGRKRGDRLWLEPICLWWWGLEKSKPFQVVSREGVSLIRCLGRRALGRFFAGVSVPLLSRRPACATSPLRTRAGVWGCGAAQPLSLRTAEFCQAVLGNHRPPRQRVLHPWFSASFTPILDAGFFWAARLADDKERAQRSGLHGRDYL